MISCIITMRRPDTESAYTHYFEKTHGLSQVDIYRAYFIETVHPIKEEFFNKLKNALTDRVLEATVENLVNDTRNQVWVAYKRGIVDNECDSIVRLCENLKINTIAGKVATVYLSSNKNLQNIIKERYFNPNIEELFIEQPVYETLLPLGSYIPMETFDLLELRDDQLINLGRAAGRNLDFDKMKHIQRIQAELRLQCVSDVLLEALDARWSDHCYHTTWKSLGNLLNRLIDASKATNNINIVSMFEDNAGVWDFYDGLSLAIKGETHNGPSAISAYFGQLTKLGGVLRDILGVGLGADPIGSFEYTATGIPGTPSLISGRPSPREVATETIRAIKEYGNTFGVPMMRSRMCFHPAYRAKPFALGGCIGLIPNDFAHKGKPSTGDLIMVIGGLTGNDGIHGASASSAGATMDQAAVQIGSPLEQVKFNTAILDLRNAGCLSALTDVGGAGLNSAIGEIGELCGVWVNMALVPLKTAGLPMWRILLSESQERMVLAVKADMLYEAKVILNRHEVRHAVIGKFTGLNRYTVVYDILTSEEEVVSAQSDNMPMIGEIGIDVPYDLLRYVPPPTVGQEDILRTTKTSLWPSLTVADLQELMPRLLGDTEICEQVYADSQYDSTVQGRLSYGPYSGFPHSVRTDYWAAKILPDKPYAVVFTDAFNPWLFEANPRLALRQCFFEILGKMVLAGVEIQNIAFCDNFYTPHLSKNWEHWLVSMVDELADLIRKFGTPVISGKDSSAGSVQIAGELIHVPPAVFLSAIGKIESYHMLFQNDWKRADNLLVQIGPSCTSAAGTVAARLLTLEANGIDNLSSDDYLAYLQSIILSDRSGWASGISIGSGGLLGTLSMRSISSNLGVELIAPEEGLWWLLAEHRCGALIEIEEEYIDSLSAQLCPRIVGRITKGGPSIRLNNLELLTPSSIEAWASSFQNSLI